jgi:hypothetical protein
VFAYLGLSCMHNIGKLHAVLNEEHRNVVAHKIPAATWEGKYKQTALGCEQFRRCKQSQLLAPLWIQECARRRLTDFPSSVYILTANPRTSRTQSADPRNPSTVLKRTKVGVLCLGSWNTLAVVTSLMFAPSYTWK